MKVKDINKLLEEVGAKAVRGELNPEDIRAMTIPYDQMRKNMLMQIEYQKLQRSMNQQVTLSGEVEFS